MRAVLRRTDDARRRSPAATTGRDRRPACSTPRCAASPSPATQLDLTRKEFELLAPADAQRRHGLTRERLIDEVWDTNWFGSTKTLDVHVSGLRKKLGDDAGHAALRAHASAAWGSASARLDEVQ